MLALSWHVTYPVAEKNKKDSRNGLGVLLAFTFALLKICSPVILLGSFEGHRLKGNTYLRYGPPFSPH